MCPLPLTVNRFLLFEENALNTDLLTTLRDLVEDHDDGPKIYTKNYNMAYPLKNDNHRRKNLGKHFFLGTQIYIL